MSMPTVIIKRDGRKVPFDLTKIENAIHAAMDASLMGSQVSEARNIACAVADKLNNVVNPTVEQIQDLVEETLIEKGYSRTAKAYILYRAERSRARDLNGRLMRTFEDLTFSKADKVDLKRENANIDADTAMGTMLKYGSESAKQFYMMRIIDPKFATAHREGDIHIHDMDFYTLTTTCCQIELRKLFKDGFSTGHGVLREPASIGSYAALAAIAIQANQNDQHGGQAVCDFDYAMADGIRKSFNKLIRRHIAEMAVYELDLDSEQAAVLATDVLEALVDSQYEPSLKFADDEMARATLAEALERDGGFGTDAAARVAKFAYTRAAADVDRETYQAMEGFIHNLNTMHSRAGAQTPFSSINYGMDTSAEGRMAIKNLLLATIAGLGHGETPIFPVQIFRVKEGVNYYPEDPSYDLFKLAIACSAKRLFPNFSFQDAPFNLQYYKGTPETEIGYMGCRTRVIGNVSDPTKEITAGRGNLSFTSINLPRLGIRAHGDLDLFFDLLDAKLELVASQLEERYEIQCRKHVYNMPFLMGQGIWIDSDKLNPTDEVREVLKHGTLTTGFIGLAECLVALTGEHHGQSEAAQRLGLEIIGHMRAFCDARSRKIGMNYTLIATPAEGLSGRFVRIDKERYGIIPGVTDRDYYTNGFHVPVYYDISAFDKIAIEAPYHALTNGGHISYVELDGDTTKNLPAFEKVIRYMHDCGIGYGSVNHPVDRDPVCGYTGIIDEECPVCHRHEDDGQPKFERIRRITGYLVGTLDRFNDAKRAEESQRVKHGVSYTPEQRTEHDLGYGNE